MILIDTSAWINFLRKSGERNLKLKVAEILDFEFAAWTCPIKFELLSGARENEKNDILEMLSFSNRVIFSDPHWEMAAEIEKTLRKNGITVPRDDIFVSACSICEEIPLLHNDRHFEIISRLFPLELQT